MINWKQDFRLLAFIQLVLGFFMLFPTLIAVYLKEESALHGFIAAYGAMAIFCTLVFYLTRNIENHTLASRDGYLFVTFTWIIATAISALPLVVSGSYVNYSSSFFEIMSGFTTQGQRCFPK